MQNLLVLNQECFNILLALTVCQHCTVSADPLYRVMLV